MIGRGGVLLLLASATLGAQGGTLPPLTSWSDQTHYYVKNAFDAGSLLIPALPAAIVMLDPPSHYPHEWKNGGAAFGRNFGDALATELAAKTGKYVAAGSFREDPRYFRSTDRGAWKRLGHAVGFTFVDRSVHGDRMLAVSNIAGAFAGGFAGRAYLPEGYDDRTHALQRTSGTYFGYAPTLLVGYMTGNIAEEFKPELKRVAKALHIPFVK